MTKKLVKILISIVVVAAILVGTIYGITTYKNSKLVAKVVSVNYLNYGNYEYMESDGIVTSDADQSVYVEQSEIIKEVYVKSGDEVQVGDKLMAYDITNLELALEKQQLTVDSLRNSLAFAQKELERLRATTPVTLQKRLVEPEEDSTEEPYYEEYMPEGYTEAELKKAISEKETEIRDMDLNRRIAELALANQKESISDGIVYAKINGTVKDVHEVNDIPNDGTPFLVVSGSDGLYVKGDITELQLDQIHIGQEVTATSWETGMSYSATISEIDTYPDENPSYWGSGNPNVSYYQYTAYIENPEGLKNGTNLQLEINDFTNNDGIYLQSSFVRSEDGKYYVMKDDNGALVKQYVTVGKVVSSGYAIEITSGITSDDYLAFPYGKTAKEGIKTEQSDDYYY